ncbi:MAG TPA: ABC transporter substrate-binding protein [Candidatus Elarobacter sp.]|nr:ABC transporter substrate-binding protein [Candidatus Elarobacter sp.]
MATRLALFARCTALAAGALLVSPSMTPAADTGPIKIGIVTSYSGVTPNAGKELDGGVAAFLKKYGDTWAGRKVELIKRDDGGPNADVAKRMAQELVVQQNVDFLFGAAFTPTAIAIESVSTQAKKPFLIVNGATSNIMNNNPYTSRYGMTIAQIAQPMARWAPQHGLKKVYILTADYAPGIEAANQFKDVFAASGGTVVGEVHIAMGTLDFSSYLQRVKDAKPDALYTFLPTGQMPIALMKGYADLGLAKDGIKVIGTGDFVTEDALNAEGDSVLGVVTSYHYSEAHPSKLNAEFVRDYTAATGPNPRPNFQAVAAYDAMHAIYLAVQKTHGDTSADKIMDALKGIAFESPRGPISIDPNTRDIVENIYMRRLEKQNGVLQNVEFETIPNVKDPLEK